MKKIWFDMDGTIADLYGVENWLDYLLNGDAFPYKAAAPLVFRRTGLQKEIPVIFCVHGHRLPILGFAESEGLAMEIIRCNRSYGPGNRCRASFP